MDFRYWLISMGPEVFERSLKDPATLIDVVDQPGVEYPGFEDFGYVCQRVYEDNTGWPLPAYTRYFRSSPAGMASWMRWAMAARFPTLWEKFNAKTTGVLGLADAAAQGDLARVEELLRGGAKADGTALLRACCGGQRAVVTCLLDAGADLHTMNSCGEGALHGAAASGGTQLIALLLERGALVNPKGARPPLFVTVENLDLPAASLLGVHGADPNVEDEEGCTPLILAASEGATEMVKLLLELGADVSHRDKEGCTALDCAQGNEELEVVSVLTQRCASDGKRG